jgi:hypothetical protein
MQKKQVWAKWHQEKYKVNLPCQVVLTRISCRKLDSDNNVMAFKAIRDQIADCIRPGMEVGRADDTDEIIWEYKQQKCPSKKKMIRIQVFC